MNGITGLDQRGHFALRDRRIGLIGGTRVEPACARFCERLGWELAGDAGTILVSGGFRHYRGEPDVPSADWSFIRGALERLQSIGLGSDARIETWLPGDEPDDLVRFREGVIRILQNRTRQSRRFTVVSATDVLVAVQGENATREMIDLALALEKPVLPLPFTGGSSADRWARNAELIREWFGIDAGAAQALESVRLAELDDTRLEELAVRVKKLLRRKLRKKCFVIMPFSEALLRLYEEAIEPAVAGQGFTPVRADRLNLVGNAIEVLRAAINNCDCAIAVITGYNLNVMYELGFAHAQNKPVMILCEVGPDGRLPADLPFDLRTELAIGYTDDLAALRRAIGDVLGRFSIV